MKNEVVRSLAEGDVRAIKIIGRVRSSWEWRISQLRGYHSIEERAWGKNHMLKEENPECSV